MTKLTTDEKIDELAGMVARGFTQVHKEINGVQKDLTKLNDSFEKHLRRSEKTHAAHEKRITIAEQLRTI